MLSIFKIVKTIPHATIICYLIEVIYSVFLTQLLSAELSDRTLVGEKPEISKTYSKTRYVIKSYYANAIVGFKRKSANIDNGKLIKLKTKTSLYFVLVYYTQKY